jgi:hypothetical protein
MANYFYTDANGQKQGPVDEQHLKELKAQGVVTPTTPLREEDWLDKFVTQLRQWQFDFETHLFLCRFCCVVIWIAAIVGGLAAGYWGYQTFNNRYAPDAAKFLAIIGVLTTWVYCAFCVAATHLLCTWSLITSKAAQLYVENCEKK